MRLLGRVGDAAIKHVPSIIITALAWHASMPKCGCSIKDTSHFPNYKVLAGLTDYQLNGTFILSPRNLENLWNSTTANAILTVMTPEREQREQNHISFEEVISNANEIMLRDGQHIPVLIMEARDDIVVGQIPDLPATHGKRMELMRFLG